MLEKRAHEIVLCTFRLSRPKIFKLVPLDAERRPASLLKVKSRGILQPCFWKSLGKQVWRRENIQAGLHSKPLQITPNGQVPLSVIQCTFFFFTILLPFFFLFFSPFPFFLSLSSSSTFFFFFPFLMKGGVFFLFPLKVTLNPCLSNRNDLEIPGYLTFYLFYLFSIALTRRFT